MNSLISNSLRELLEDSFSGKLFWNEPMKKHTSIRIGGDAEVLVTPKTQNEIKKILLLSKEYDVPITVIGNGSKLLVGDEGISGLVIKICKGYDSINISGEKIHVLAGCLLPHLAKVVADNGLSGLEYLIGIPGTVGASIIMNSGAHGHDIGECVSFVETIDYNGKFTRYSKDELNFNYRSSLMQNQKCIVIGVELELASDDPKKIQERIRHNLDWRLKNQPHKYPNAGSIFKNPLGQVAGRLIDESNLKGMIIGGAKISEQKANFFENIDNAKASDIIQLMRISQEAVYKKFGIRLEPEIRIIGHHVNDL